MSNPWNDFLFEEMKRLSRISDDQLVEEYRAAEKIAEKIDLPSEYRYLELIEHEIYRRNRGNNSTWWKLRREN